MNIIECEAGYVMAEDMSCVPESFYATPEPTPPVELVATPEAVEPAPVVSDAPTAPVEGRTDTIYVPVDGTIVQETTGEVIEYVGVTPTPEPPMLAVTGADDVSPFVVIVGAVLLTVGIITSRRARRA